jgi:ribosome-associated protein
MDPIEFARQCALAAAEKKAEDIVVLDLREISSFADAFVICTATSEPQMKAISSAIRESLRESCGRKPIHEDGATSSQWLAIDYGDVIIHVFLGEKRDYYRLEDLWKDAPEVSIPELAA